MVRGTDSALIFRNFEHEFPIVTHGEGIYVYDEDGKKYMDGGAGAAGVSNIGHGVEEVIRAMEAQARKMAHNPSFQFANRPAMELAELLASICPKGVNKVWFVSDGSEATDNAVKLARQYQIERGYPGKSIVICRWQAFQGATIGALAVGGHTYRRRKYVPLFVNSPHIGPMYCYRCYYEQKYPECKVLCARALEKEIRQLGPENVAAFIAEPVVAASLGAVPPVDEYFPMIREICDKYDVVFIADEVFTGFGRTGPMFALENWKVTPDIMTVAKGISGGYVPLGAVVAHEKIIDLAKKNKSNIVLGHTYSAHHLTCAVGVAAVKYILKHDLVKQGKENGAYMIKQMKRLEESRMVGNVRGLGLFAGVEFVKDKRTKEPFAPSEQVAARVESEALKRGLIVIPGSGSVDGVMGDHILVSPPLIISRSEIDEMISIMEESIAQVEREI